MPCKHSQKSSSFIRQKINMYVRVFWLLDMLMGLDRRGHVLNGLNRFSSYNAFRGKPFVYCFLRIVFENNRYHLRWVHRMRQLQPSFFSTLTESILSAHTFNSQCRLNELSTRGSLVLIIRNYFLFLSHARLVGGGFHWLTSSFQFTRRNCPCALSNRNFSFSQGDV